MLLEQHGRLTAEQLKMLVLRREGPFDIELYLLLAKIDRHGEVHARFL